MISCFVRLRRSLLIFVILAMEAGFHPLARGSESSDDETTNQERGNSERQVPIHGQVVIAATEKLAAAAEVWIVCQGHALMG